jgi:hypothetical protein
MREIVKIQVDISGSVDRFSVNFGEQYCLLPDNLNVQERNRFG